MAVHEAHGGPFAVGEGGRVVVERFRIGEIVEPGGLIDHRGGLEELPVVVPFRAFLVHVLGKHLPAVGVLVESAVHDAGIEGGQKVLLPPYRIQAGTDENGLGPGDFDGRLVLDGIEEGIDIGAVRGGSYPYIPVAEGPVFVIPGIAQIVIHHLPPVAHAGNGLRRIPCLLQRGKKHPRENGDDGDDHKKLDQGESMSLAAGCDRGNFHDFSFFIRVT